MPKVYQSLGVVMEENRSLDKGGIRKTERSLIEQTLKEIYLALEGSEMLVELHSLYLQVLLKRLVPDFLIKKPEGRIRSIVEVGCGTGMLVNYLSMLLPDTQVVGIDPDPNNIALAKSTVGDRKNVHFYCGDAFRLSGFACDRLILTNQFQHMRDHAQYRKLLSRSMDWLTADGDLYIRQKNPAAVFCLDFWGKMFSKDENGLILHEWLRATLQGVGYPAAEDCIAGSRTQSMLAPYLYLRAPRNGSLQFDEFTNLQKARRQARDVARRTIGAEPVLQTARPVQTTQQTFQARPQARVSARHESRLPAAITRASVRDASIDDALSLIFGDTPKEFVHDFS